MLRILSPLFLSPLLRTSLLLACFSSQNAHAGYGGEDAWKYTGLSDAGAVKFTSQDGFNLVKNVPSDSAKGTYGPRTFYWGTPDTMILQGEHCHFEKLAAPSCSEKIANLSKWDLYTALRLVIDHAAKHIPVSSGTLALYNHHLATLFTSHALVGWLAKAADDANQDATVWAADEGQNSYDSASYEKYGMFWDAQEVLTRVKWEAAYNSAYNSVVVSRGARPEDEFAVAIHTADSIATETARDTVYDAAYAAAFTAGRSHSKPSEDLIQQIGTEAVLKYLVINGVTIWRTVYDKTLAGLEQRLTMMPASFKLAEWSDSDMDVPLFQPFRLQLEKTRALMSQTR